MDYKDKSKQQLVEEKLALQNTIITLTDEIESLSVKNEEFLSCLQNKDFYREYQTVKDELKTLKSAHAILINMIKDEELKVQTYVSTKDSRLGESDDLIRDTSFILGTDISNVSNKRQNQRMGPLQEIDTNQVRNSSLSSLFGWNAFNGILKNGKLSEQEIDLKEDKNNIKNSVEFLANRLENVDINFLKHKSP